MAIGTLFVPTMYQSPQVYQDCTNNVPIVKNSQKAVKTAKMTIGVPNRHMSTQSPPNTQSLQLRSNISETVEDKGIHLAYETNMYRKCPFSECRVCSGCVDGFSATAELLVIGR